MYKSDESSDESSFEQVNNAIERNKNYRLSKILLNDQNKTSLTRQESNLVTPYKTTGFSATNVTDIKRTKPFDKTIDDRTDKSRFDKPITQSDAKITCGNCSKPIYDEQPMKFDVKSYHRYCFKCSSCSAQLDNTLNQAYRCEVEKRFYCIRCCDCKCWLTNTDKYDAKVEKNKLVKERGSDKISLDHRPKLADEIANTKLGAQFDTKIYKNKQTNGRLKKCKFCNQVLPENLNDLNTEQSTKLVQKEKHDVQIAKAEQTAKAAQLRNNLKTEVQGGQATGRQFNLDETQLKENLAKQNLISNLRERDEREQRLREQLISDSRQRLEEQGVRNEQLVEKAQQNLADQIRKVNLNRSPQIGRPDERIRLAKKPVIGPRIARIIDKLEHSLNQTKRERKFQENFYQNLAESLEQIQQAQSAATRKVGRLKERNLNDLGIKKQPTKLDRAVNLPNVEQQDRPVHDQSARRQTDFRPNQQKEQHTLKNVKHTERNAQNVMQPLDRQTICCPNCKAILPTNLYRKQGGCRPFCTLHCPSEQKPNQTGQQTYLNKQPKRDEENRFGKPPTRTIIDNRRTKPYNLLLNSPTNQPSPPCTNFNRHSPITQTIKSPTKPNIVTTTDRSAASETGVEQVCCKCGLKVYFNEKVNSAPDPAHKSCLKCSICGCALSPGRRHSPNAETLCNFPCSNRLCCTGRYGYAFNVRHT